MKASEGLHIVVVLAQSGKFDFQLASTKVGSAKNQRMSDLLRISINLNLEIITAR
jgi:hypothetical protein